MMMLIQNIKFSDRWLFLFALITVFIFRLPYSVLAEIDWDESCYFVVSQHLLNGGVLFQTIADFKGPFIYFIFASVISVFGNNVVALHIFTTLYLLGTMALIALISKRLFPQHCYAIAPFAYGAFFSQDMQGMSSNGELMMMLPVAAAAYFLIRYLQQ